MAGWSFVGSDETPPPSRVAALVETTTAASAEQSVSFWQARVDSAPQSFLDRTQLGISLASKARERASLIDYERAESELRAALQINPDYPAARLALGQALHSQHDFSGAKQLADELLADNASNDAALALLGDAAFELGDYADAQRRYDELARRERSAPAISRLSRLAYLTGAPEQSVALAQEALDASRRLALTPSETSFYYFQLGTVRFQTGDTDGAIEALREALLLDPDNPGATETLAFVYTAVGDDAAARPLYEEMLAGGGAADLYGLYADLLVRAGETTLAAKQEQLGAKLAEETVDRFPAERRHLAHYFMTRDPQRAVELARADLDERRDVGAYDTYAWALFHAGKIAEAQAAITQVLDGGIVDATISYHAAAIAGAAGDSTSARQLAESALAINADFHPSESADAARLAGS